MPDPSLSRILRDSQQELARALGLAPEVAMIEARALAGAALDATREELLVLEPAGVSPGDAARLGRLLARRLRHEPVAHITGRREFYGIGIRVGPGVLVPRPETELVVDRVRAMFPRDSRARIADLGTGSGAIAVALAANLPLCSVEASDIDPAAVENAGLNVREHRLANVRVRRSDWLGSYAPGETFDAIVANPPYLTAAETRDREGDLAHEPGVAFDGGEDGLGPLMKVVGQSPAHLVEGGALVVEHGSTQGGAVAGAFSAGGFTEVETFEDLAGLPRVTAGRRA